MVSSAEVAAGGHGARRAGREPGRRAPGRWRVLASSRVKTCRGSRPMSSAKRQKTSRSRKWATRSAGSSPGPAWTGRCRRCGPRPRWVTASLVTPGRSFSGSKKTARRISRLRGSARAAEGDLVGGGDGLREVGVDHDAVQVADHQQGRVVQGVAVAQELVVGGVQVLVLALVLPAEEALLPDVGEAVAAAVLGRALLEAERLARWGRPRRAWGGRGGGTGRGSAPGRRSAPSGPPSATWRRIRVRS